MPLPMGVADPIFTCQLALELKMPVGELGTRMSNYELCVLWPAFFQWREGARQREQERASSRADRRMGSG